MEHITTIQNRHDFEAVFKGAYSELCGYANKFLKDLDASEEVVQEMFVKLWENRSELDITSSLRSYLFRSVRNACLNQIKHIGIREEYKAHNEREIESSQNSLDAELNASELEVQIRKTIDQLPPERKKVFLMSRYEGLKYREIAERLNISVKTVENQMGKAIKYLRAELSEYMLLLAIILINFFR